MLLFHYIKKETEKLNGIQGHRACKVKVWLGIQVCMTPNAQTFPHTTLSFRHSSTTISRSRRVYGDLA